jgi:alanine racemase
MTRYGASPADAKDLVRRVRDLIPLRLDGFSTHFAAADERDDWFARQQLARFLAICSQLEREGFDLGCKHASNSAGALRVADSGLDTVRTGIALSGCYASEFVPRQPALRPAVTMTARVIRLHQPPIGASIGYGRTYKVQRPMRTALIACGYADGLPRACSNRGAVLIHGQRAPLVGTVSMDMAMADVTHIPHVQPGDVAVIIGESGSERLSMEDLANDAGIIVHETLVRLSSRAPRVYLSGGRPLRAAMLSAEHEVTLPQPS